MDAWTVRVETYNEETSLNVNRMDQIVTQQYSSAEMRLIVKTSRV